MMIGSSALAGLKKDFNSTFAVSREIGKDDMRTGFFGLLLDGVLRVVSPLL